jgi:catechol 2,3-dioxygenase-like lactoylglutathione lyase family enzyme
MNRLVAMILFAAIAACGALPARAAERPRILGIDHVSFFTTAPDGVKQLYGVVLGLGTAPPIEAGETLRYMVGPQWVGYSPAPDATSNDRMDHVAFSTDNAFGLRDYLKGKGVPVSKMSELMDHSPSFTVTDPEGHTVEFVQHIKATALVPPSSAVSHRMIHTGFIVHSRETEDRFYRDILGFHLYWYGGMHPERTDWVAMQVPDGTDWLEYMLNQPEHPDLRITGVMNHISLGVPEMKQAEATLEAHGWKPHGDEHTQIGKDGKWQLNVYDPDLVRVELMDFKPVEKPCCSDFQGPHPSE